MNSKYDIMFYDQTNHYQRSAFSNEYFNIKCPLSSTGSKKSYKIGVTAASKYYKVSRQAIYEWRHKYDGKSWKSLLDRSHRPHHQSEQTLKEKELILRLYCYHKNDMIMLWMH